VHHRVLGQGYGEIWRSYGVHGQERREMLLAFITSPAKTRNIEGLSACRGSILNDPDIQRPSSSTCNHHLLLLLLHLLLLLLPLFLLLLLLFLPLSLSRFIHASNCPHLRHPQYRNNPRKIIVRGFPTHVRYVCLFSFSSRE